MGLIKFILSDYLCNPMAFIMIIMGCFCNGCIMWLLKTTLKVASKFKIIFKALRTR